MRIETTLLADEGETLKGGTMSLQFTYIDGVPLVSHSHFDVTLLMGKHHVQVITDHVYSRFQKFAVTTTIVPVETAENRENEPND